MAVSVQESCTVLRGATTISVFLDENPLFKQFCESLVSSPHAITHAATQALQPRTRASSFWGDWRGKFWTHGVTSAVPKTHPHCQMQTRPQWHAKAEEIWSHAHQCKQCKIRPSLPQWSRRRRCRFVSKRNESKHALNWKTLPVIIHPPINYHCGNTGRLHYIQTIENKAIFCQHRGAENQSVLETPIKGETQSCFRMALNNHSATYCTPKEKKTTTAILTLIYFSFFLFFSLSFTFYWWARTAT